MGVLLIDSIDEPHRSIAGDYQDLFRSVLTEAGAQPVFFDGTDDLPGHHECDGWVIPGSRVSVYDGLPWIAELEAWAIEAVDARVPLGGVCFGHQLIAQGLGTPVEKASVGWNIGAIDYEVRSQPSFVDAMPERFRLIASHQDQVTAVPDGAELVASAGRCPVAAYSIDDHVLCVQGHPEFVPDLAASLYRSRVDRIGAAPIAEAIATLDRPLDRVDVARWLVSVVERRRS